MPGRHDCHGAARAAVATTDDIALAGEKLADSASGVVAVVPTVRYEGRASMSCTGSHRLQSRFRTARRSLRPTLPSVKAVVRVLSCAVVLLQLVGPSCRCARAASATDIGSGAASAHCHGATASRSDAPVDVPAQHGHDDACAHCVGPQLVAAHGEQWTKAAWASAGASPYVAVAVLPPPFLSRVVPADPVGNGHSWRHPLFRLTCALLI